jgi:ectoine hydroxylase-related dioxygenase (phytanoyl-CoA dioxygenase family)
MMNCVERDRDSVEFEKNGVTVLKDMLNSDDISSLGNELADLEETAALNQRRLRSFGVRNLLNRSKAARALAESETILKIAENYIGKGVRVVRAIYFDKTPEANWKVPWHQDLTITVRERLDVEEFTPWTRKADVWHVQPSVDILEKMITLRIHLDDADERNGALKVIAGSHNKGRLDAGQIKAIRAANESRICRVKQGDCLVMRPLLLHSSSAGEEPRRRRIIHLEFSNVELPGGLEWYGS